MFDVICIGGGPAGLTAAHSLSKEKKTVLVLEKDPIYLGGISKTVCNEGFRFDIGGHRFFSKSGDVVALWKEILGDDLLTRQRISRIFYNKKFFPYPLNIPKTLANLGLFESARCGFSFLKAKVFPYQNPENFREWVVNSFGERLFQIFFKTYTEKVWGMSCDDISVDWAQQRIKGLSLFGAFINGMKSLLGISRSNTPKTLIEEFYYPRLGPGMFWEKIAEVSKTFGCQIKLDANVNKLRYLKDQAIWEVSYSSSDNKTETIHAKHIISTTPIKELANFIEELDSKVVETSNKLRYRDFLTVALVVKEDSSIEDNWIYIHDPDVLVGRIQNFKAWSPEMVPNTEDTCYGLEYFCQENDNLWSMSDEELIELAKKEISQIKLTTASQVKSGYIVRQEKAYPVYDKDYKETVAIIATGLKKHAPNLHLIGRNGMHKYNNQDHSMMTAMLTAKNIIADKEIYDIWLVNQDAEYHESGASGERLVPHSK